MWIQPWEWRPLLRKAMEIFTIIEKEENGYFDSLNRIIGISCRIVKMATVIKLTH